MMIQNKPSPAIEGRGKRRGLIITRKIIIACLCYIVGFAAVIKTLKTQTGLILVLSCAGAVEKPTTPIVAFHH